LNYPTNSWNYQVQRTIETKSADFEQVEAKLFDELNYPDRLFWRVAPPEPTDSVPPVTTVAVACGEGELQSA